MARIAVHRASFESGTFPPVCCKTGVHTDRYADWQFAGRLRGRVPMTERAERHSRRTRLVAWVLGVAALAAALAGPVADVDGAVVASMILAALWLIVTIVAVVSTPNAKPTGDGTVELSNVHRRFVETIESAWAQQRQDPPS